MVDRADVSVPLAMALGRAIHLAGLFVNRVASGFDILDQLSGPSASRPLALEDAL
jgi:hypothetical protein